MLNRRAFAVLIAALSTALVLSAGQAQGEASPARNVVLVHGLFADGSSGGKVIPILQ